MKVLSAILYYIQSGITLVTKTHFWIIPLVLFRKPLLLTLHNGQKFYVNSLIDIWTLKEVLLDKQYELYDSPQKSWKVIDIGAGVADFSIMLSPLVQKVYAYDVDTNRIELSKKNISLHKKKNIKLLQEGVKNLDDIFSKHKLDKCDLLKIDCEGCEYPVFFNAKRKSLKKINRIIMEAHLFNDSMRRDYMNLKKILAENGFSVIEKDNRVHSYLKYLYAWKQCLTP